jgi:hypothetical protein
MYTQSSDIHDQRAVVHARHPKVTTHRATTPTWYADHVGVAYTSDSALDDPDSTSVELIP